METFPVQIDCGEQLIIIMSILLPLFTVFSLLTCWIITPHPHQASNIIEYQYQQEDYRSTPDIDDQEHD
ncbi:unnamed protein product [Adineta ricciae]|uniref:Uncharacterized protein n=1 Tax=Adineta ricciae TaxID=249248 RepID=A0A814PP93_ADIRI|nr:unnamed protein product [Adineta ricciae]